jgi:multidrug efflux pump subunit AcrA (membrane-fusion protein)
LSASENQYQDLVNQENDLKAQMGEIDPNELAMLNSYLQSGDMSGFGNVMGASTMSGLGSPGIIGAGQPERGKLSQREYAAKTGQTYDAGSDYNRTYSKQEKSAKKAQDELLKSIERQYSEARTAGTSDLEKAKQEDLLRLSGMFSFANSDPNDEQRAQYQTRTTNDYAGQLATLLEKLSSAQAEDVSSAKQNYQGVLQQIAQARADQQAKVQQLQQQQQQQRFQNWIAAFKLKYPNYGGNNYDTGSGAVDIFGNPIS